MCIRDRLNPDSMGFWKTGKIDVYNMNDGKLKSILELPSHGEVMCFEKYPNDVWYVKNIWLPEREIYKISFDSYTDEPKVKKLFPK